MFGHLFSAFIMQELVGTLNQEKALEEAFSVTEIFAKVGLKLLSGTPLLNCNNGEEGRKVKRSRDALSECFNYFPSVQADMKLLH